MRLAFILVLSILAIPADAQTGWKTVNPEIQSIVDSVSKESLESMLRQLDAFETRNTMSDQTSPRTGIGAARQWIYDQFKSFSPRLEVSFDTHQIPKGGRIYRDVELRNVIAVLPGTDPIGKNRRFIISGHYDSISETSYTAGSRSETKAPGANDDGSGTAAVASDPGRTVLRHRSARPAFPDLHRGADPGGPDRRYQGTGSGNRGLRPARRLRSQNRPHRSRGSLRAARSGTSSSSRPRARSRRARSSGRRRR